MMDKQKHLNGQQSKKLGLFGRMINGMREKSRQDRLDLAFEKGRWQHQPFDPNISKNNNPSLVSSKKETILSKISGWFADSPQEVFAKREMVYEKIYQNNLSTKQKFAEEEIIDNSGDINSVFSSIKHKLAGWLYQKNEKENSIFEERRKTMELIALKKKEVKIAIKTKVEQEIAKIKFNYKQKYLNEFWHRFNGVYSNNGDKSKLIEKSKSALGKLNEFIEKDFQIIDQWVINSKILESDNQVINKMFFGSDNLLDEVGQNNIKHTMNWMIQAVNNKNNKEQVIDSLSNEKISITKSQLQNFVLTDGLKNQSIQNTVDYVFQLVLNIDDSGADEIIQKKSKSEEIGQDLDKLFQDHDNQSLNRDATVVSEADYGRYVEKAVLSKNEKHLWILKFVKNCDLQDFFKINSFVDDNQWSELGRFLLGKNENLTVDVLDDQKFKNQLSGLLNNMTPKTPEKVTAPIIPPTLKTPEKVIAPITTPTPKTPEKVIAPITTPTPKTPEVVTLSDKSAPNLVSALDNLFSLGFKNSGRSIKLKYYLNRADWVGMRQYLQDQLVQNSIVDQINPEVEMIINKYMISLIKKSTYWKTISKNVINNFHANSLMNFQEQQQCKTALYAIIRDRYLTDLLFAELLPARPNLAVKIERINTKIDITPIKNEIFQLAKEHLIIESLNGIKVNFHILDNGLTSLVMKSKSLDIATKRAIKEVAVELVIGYYCKDFDCGRKIHEIYQALIRKNNGHDKVESNLILSDFGFNDVASRKILLEYLNGRFPELSEEDPEVLFQKLKLEAKEILTRNIAMLLENNIDLLSRLTDLLSQKSRVKDFSNINTYFLDNLQSEIIPRDIIIPMLKQDYPNEYDSICVYLQNNDFDLAKGVLRGISINNFQDEVIDCMANDLALPSKRPFSAKAL